MLHSNRQYSFNHNCTSTCNAIGKDEQQMSLVDVCWWSERVSTTVWLKDGIASNTPVSHVTYCVPSGVDISVGSYPCGAGGLSVCAVLPDMASCWILNWMLKVGFSSGLEAPVCRLMDPFRLGSFWGLILPTSHDKSCENKGDVCINTRTMSTLYIIPPDLYRCVYITSS